MGWTSIADDLGELPKWRRWWADTARRDKQLEQTHRCHCLGRTTAFIMVNPCGGRKGHEGAISLTPRSWRGGGGAAAPRVPPQPPLQREADGSSRGGVLRTVSERATVEFFLSVMYARRLRQLGSAAFAVARLQLFVDG